MIVDSHCHCDMLDLERLGLSLSEVVANAKSEGVERILTIGVDLKNAQRVITIAEQFEGVYASVGLHPSETVDHEPEEDDYLPFASHKKVVAIGEMGLDYYYNDDGHDNQQLRFRRQIRLAHKLQKPIIIHTRNAKQDTLAIMREENASAVGGVMHCFTEDYDMAKQAMDLGFYISFSGIVTFKNANNVREVAEKVPLEKMLIETDAPYLTPVPLRGKPNQPANVRRVAEFMADFKQVSFDEVCRITSENACRLFSLR